MSNTTLKRIIASIVIICLIAYGLFQLLPYLLVLSSNVIYVAIIPLILIGAIYGIVKLIKRIK